MLWLHIPHGNFYIALQLATMLSYIVAKFCYYWGGPWQAPPYEVNGEICPPD